MNKLVIEKEYHVIKEVLEVLPLDFVERQFIKAICRGLTDENLKQLINFKNENNVLTARIEINKL